MITSLDELINIFNYVIPHKLKLIAILAESSIKCAINENITFINIRYSLNKVLKMASELGFKPDSEALKCFEYWLH